jgi:hypothetical protein
LPTHTGRQISADLRNERAAKELLRLATAADQITDSHWEKLSPFYDPESDGWRETVSRCTRDVGFRTNPTDFAAFVQTILDTLAVTA